MRGELHQGLAADGLMTFWETAVPLAARCAERLGLPGNPPAGIQAAKNKHETRRLMERAGLPTPKNFLIDDSTQLAAAAAHVGFPSVLKPIEGLLSIGVVRVNDEMHFRQVRQPSLFSAQLDAAACWRRRRGVRTTVVVCMPTGDGVLARIRQCAAASSSPSAAGSTNSATQRRGGEECSHRRYRCIARAGVQRRDRPDGRHVLDQGRRHGAARGGGGDAGRC
jgi:hypothetical protein